MKFLSLLLTMIFTAALSGCASAPVSNTPGAINDAEYFRIVKQQTKETSQYDGFYQTFQASVTLLTTELETAGLARTADFQRWDATRLQKERDRSFQELAASTKVFIRLFTPETQYNDMHQPTSIWKVYLDHGGQRFEGKVKKLTEKFVEIKNRFPHMDRFSTGYEVTFKVPTTSVEAGTAKIILTSGVGSAEFVFQGK